MPECQPRTLWRGAPESWRGDYHALARSSDERGFAQWEPILGSRNIGCG
jgi:hypothetical protein